MRYLKWILAGIAGVIAYKVWLKVHAYRMQKQPRVATSTNRQPGVISGIKDMVSGVFSTGPNYIAPPTNSAYGTVGVAREGDAQYTSDPANTRVPSFLQGATGGVADTPQPGRAPPGILGGPPPPGSNAYYSPTVKHNHRAMTSSLPGKNGLTSLNPNIPPPDVLQ